MKKIGKSPPNRGRKRVYELQVVCDSCNAGGRGGSAGFLIVQKV